jgi:hypothetical protein
MDTRFSWYGCSYCFRAIAIVVMLVAIFPGYTSAQEVPSIGKQEMAPAGSQGNQQAPSAGSPRLRFSDLKLGIFGGGGQMSVHRDVAQGGPFPAWWAIPPYPSSSAFRHHSSTRLDDLFVGGEWGFRWGDILEGTLSLDTNVGAVQDHFKQKSTAPAGQTPSYGYETTLGVLRVADNATGFITLDNKFRIFNVDQCFAFPKEIAVFASPVMPKLRFLAGWKYSLISSDIDRSFAAYAPLERHGLPGTSGWENLWRNSVPFTTGFTMDQRFWWTGPSLGMRLAGPLLQKLPGRWYLEGKGVPYAFGNYKFHWSGAYEDGFFFYRGQQTTDMAVHGYFLEVKGGAEIKLLGRLFLDLWSKYSYLHMQGSGHEVQSSQNNFLATQSLLQDADQDISINENFWAVGANLVLQF